ncbi:hypothetical protein AVEN_239890-1 [Araneus ventricosus]|uniref:Uncharacterized protein n=1 Tax=Araneus ventricosus TaxID=182803 RepID=A0A4Y2LB46_ARAVE|nr:hypothetical protein AVEN_239890-1 [Araneus ventricosus]
MVAMVNNDFHSSSKPPKFGLPEFYCLVCVLLKDYSIFRGSLVSSILIPLRVNLTVAMVAMVNNDFHSSSKPPKFGLPEFYCLVCVLLKDYSIFRGSLVSSILIPLRVNLTVAMVAMVNNDFHSSSNHQNLVAEFYCLVCVLRKIIPFFRDLWSRRYLFPCE